VFEPQRREAAADETFGGSSVSSGAVVDSPAISLRKQLLHWLRVLDPAWLSPVELASSPVPMASQETD
jgi:hypothetical protein